jgi:CPA1 family monovalent cation:H+ antiporter
LFTLLVEGTTMQFLLNRLGLVGRTTVQLDYERRHARVLAARRARRRLEQMHEDGAFSAHTWEEIAPELNYYVRQAAFDLQALVKREPSLKSQELVLARREMLRTQRSVMSMLFRDGVISDEVYSEMIGEIDAALVALERLDEAYDKMLGEIDVAVAELGRGSVSEQAAVRGEPDASETTSREA